MPIKKHLTQFGIAMLATAVIILLFTLPTAATSNQQTDNGLVPAVDSLADSLTGVDETAGSSASCRYGVSPLFYGATKQWFPTLGNGWFVNFTPNKPAAAPNGAEFMYTLRMKNGVFDPPLSSINAQLSSNPGAVWFVGSEIEVNFPTSGDKTYPKDYARAYKQAYDYIKQRDPSARVGVGGMSMATPARIQYMDIAWDEYRRLYGADMPVDVWNIHVYILGERVYGSTTPYHGQIALGTTPSLGKQSSGGNASRCSQDAVYCIAEHDSLAVFQQQVIAFRTWMKDNGQQDKPLVISEMGTLYQPGYKDENGRGFDQSRVASYLNATFNWLETASSASIGYPQDNNKLVQQWLWYTTTARPGWTGYSAVLLKDNYADYSPGSVDALSTVGLAFRNQANSTPKNRNLKAASASGTQTGPTAARISADFVNNGTLAVGSGVKVTFYANSALTQVIGTATVNGEVWGCGTDRTTASVAWNGLSNGTHTFWAKVDSSNQVGETSEGDNVISGTVTIGSGGNYPTATPTNTPVPSQPTATPTNTPIPSQPTATPTPTNTAVPSQPTATPIPAACTTGTILREYWTNVSGTTVNDLTSHPNYPNNRSGFSNPASFEAPTNWGTNYGTRMSGYLYAPVTGQYRFWIASDDNSELWLSTNDNPANLAKIASVTGYTAVQQWTKYPSQQSALITLQAGQLYYIQALHKESVGGDNLAVAWQAPGGTRQVIPGANLCPAELAPSATATPTATATNTPIPATATSTPTATNTPVPAAPTATPTNTPVPPTATNTPVPAAPTATPTNTPVPSAPTATPTPTNTAVPPTATSTPVPDAPTATPTNTPVPPTATNTPAPGAPTATPTPTPTNTPVPPVDTQPPTIEWVEPVGNEEIHTLTAVTTILKAFASDNDAVEYVHFSRWDDVNKRTVDIGDVFNAPYTASIDTAVLNIGYNQINAQAYDRAGNVSERVVIWLVKPDTSSTPTPMPTTTPTATATPIDDDTPPTLNWQVPVGNEEVYEVTQDSVDLQVDATDTNGIQTVQFIRWDSANEVWIAIATDDAAPYTAVLNTTTIGSEWTQIAARALDTLGNSTQANIWLYRDTGAPGVTETPTPPPTATYTPTATTTPTPTITPTAEPSATPPPPTPNPTATPPAEEIYRIYYPVFFVN